jgi:hypothetical protein
MKLAGGPPVRTQAVGAKIFVLCETNSLLARWNLSFGFPLARQSTDIRWRSEK